MKKRILWVAVDLTVAALVVLAVWIVNYKIPQEGIKAVTFPRMEAGEDSGGVIVPVQENKPKVQPEEQTEMQPDSFIVTNVVMDTQDWHEKFADKFTDTVVVTDTSYTSPDLSIKSCFQTAFAQDTYGVGYSEKLSDMSSKMKSVLAVNGDSYSNNRHQDNGTIIRNGIVYRNERTDMETCVLNWNGTMDIYSPDQIDIQQLIEKGAYQSWIFGLSLLDENGKAKESFLTWSYIRQSHPRTAIGYYEPGHYCLLLVDGRQKSSRGMFLDEMAQVFEDLGCRAAYNLDGGIVPL